MDELVHSIFIVNGRISHCLFEGVHMDGIFRRTSGGKWRRWSRALHLVHVHLLAADEGVSVLVCSICFRLLNVCTVTLAIVAVKRIVSVHADDFGIWRMQFLLKMHMFLHTIALLLTGC